ncbi:MAG: hydrogenase nickel incorporation protein HypB [Rhodospirillales bacterium]|nr:hydrogenase nickel incorporation protein HypB [Rhodospirillales bacterium]
MCNDCGCAVPDSAKHHDRIRTHTASVAVLKDLLAENDRTARHNQVHFDAAGVFAINLMSAPGSGKTALLEATIEALKGKRRVAVIEGDLATENDAERIRRHGVPAVQITTGTACHLDAHMIHEVLHDMPLQDLDILFIENVGNLVCPASFDLGQHRNVTLLSVPEGDDKPAKYPVMFRGSDAILVSKTDLLPHFDDFRLERAQAAVRSIACDSPIISVSVRTSNGLRHWIDWLDRQLAQYRGGERPAVAVEAAS